MNKSASQLKAEILELTREFSRLTHRAQRPGNDPLRAQFDPSTNTVPYAGRVFDEEEVAAAVDATLDFWLTLGSEGAAFEKELAEFLGVRSSLVVNSGSSANLIAFSTLTSPRIPSDKRVFPGDEVITVAAGFPTTVAPIIQCGAVPVFIDANPTTANADCSLLEQAFKPGKTKAVFIAHALGSPFDLGAILSFCKQHGLWLIEDNCDALGSTYTLPLAKAQELGLTHLIKQAESGHTRVRVVERSGVDCLVAPTGAWGDISTQSFYPPHHLTMGEGGAVNIVRDAKLRVIAESFRDWGRDCWCASGQDNTCNKRFKWQLGELPLGYDHKYIYSHLGYNLKPLDPQAAIGRAQLRKLPQFIESRKQNWRELRNGLADLEEFFSFSLPTHANAWNGEGFEWNERYTTAECSWFGFMIRIRDSAPFSRSDLARFLDEQRIGNRMFFGGNLTRQPVFVGLKNERPDAFRIVGNLSGADEIMNHGIFLGTYPGLTKDMIEYMLLTVHDFVKRTTR